MSLLQFTNTLGLHETTTILAKWHVEKVSRKVEASKGCFEMNKQGSKIK